MLSIKDLTDLARSTSSMGLINLGHEADPVLTRIVDEDKVRWWKKPNLRLLYLLLYPTCMGIEITSGFDSQMINGLQLVTAWNKCKYFKVELSSGYACESNTTRLWNGFYQRKRSDCIQYRRATTWHNQQRLQPWSNFGCPGCAMGCSKVGTSLEYHAGVNLPMCWRYHPRVFCPW